jgi:hypothetical protein
LSCCASSAPSSGTSKRSHRTVGGALALYIRHATSQAIGRRDGRLRGPALLAFCAETAARVTDEIVDLFDDAIAS